MRFFESCSWTRMTFSVPLTMKYPPGSSGHSTMRASWASLRPVRTHLFDRSMIGIRPMETLRLRTTFFPRVYWMVTRMGAE
jgi:hypothetical protein